MPGTLFWYSETTSKKAVGCNGTCKAALVFIVQLDVTKVSYVIAVDPIVFHHERAWPLNENGDTTWAYGTLLASQSPLMGLRASNVR